MDMELMLLMDTESLSSRSWYCGTADERMDEPLDMKVFSVIPRDAIDAGYACCPGVLELVEDMDILDRLWLLDPSLGGVRR